MRIRVALLVLLLAASAVAAAGCGGGSAGTAGTSAGGARGFLVPEGDNSIPNFGTEAPGPERRGARAVLAAFLTARSAGPWGFD